MVQENFITECNNTKSPFSVEVVVVVVDEKIFSGPLGAVVIFANYEAFK